ncbi:hypothetical protein JQN72_04400 [Phycicoccus sp. CSK15P-2]|uniref:hypothetical protein n=1 Tax=Phycicoccus sp. CSK15P-2 TaxID=2807627 RepID=UPI001952433D|nr:hypothetical protein [Phycicoccus sp. CSK15P-2]MBM6403483.1 hypothetical protein [Phycicoccus sp. CSK15P-2]
MSRRHDDTDPVDHDPTGMRALLGSLPDPAPMPADLVDRIGAALADEARLRDGWSAPEAPSEARAGEGVVVPMPRRARWRLVGVAAAVVAALGVGGVVLESLRPGGTVASLGVPEPGSDESAGTGPEADRSGALAPTERLGGDEAMRVEVVASGMDVTADDLGPATASLIGGMAAAPEQPQVAPNEQADGSGASGLADPVVARACSTALGVRPADAVVVVLTTVDTVPAALVVARGDDGTRTVWAVAPTCGSTPAVEPDVLAGPVPVP